MIATFGVVRELAIRLTATPFANTDVWGAKFFANVLRDDAAARALEIVNRERNNLAHGRQSLALAEIKGLVVQGLQHGAWGNISQTDGELRLADWTPWVVTSRKTGQTGLFVRWQNNAIRYLVPETGEVFKQSRKAAVSSS